ncbi:Putative Eukaryotic translation initiation factor 4 gamma [[Torrubiella] hemipterigena]|uniref:Putative Eukaryotic translation initiation factor 4 gamma n=1 Tax=[Torrubiella] hemipterigena TaxID=1531966 RepID=A0A0A1T7Q8_9HYPO|nr:Putative Eukaryotic translation initiation factor 4 gamma [[Torrubiella] hemipterigena]
MAANTSGTFVPNGGPVGGAKPGIQFGFDSPAMAQTTPQSAAAAPIPIPGGNGNAPSVPSPANSPSPIPQPSASGGRPPSGIQSGNQMTFGSLGSDGERHVRQGSVPANTTGTPAQPGAHFRRESSHSVQGENNRGNYQGGRGRGYNPNYNNQMGYPPNNQFRNGQGRGMPPAFQPQGRGMPYPNSPQANRSPAPVPSLPGTPNMPPANMQMQTPPQYHYPPPMAPQHQQNFGYPPQQMNQYGQPMNMPYNYNNMGYMPPQGQAGGYNPQFVPPYHQHSQSMSRSPSQADRPSSASQPNQPAIVSSTPQGTPAKPSGDFVKPRKSAAIQIKNAAGEVVDTSAFKQPASPAPATQQSKAPPATTAAASPAPAAATAAASPSPAPKAVVATHTRSDSQATPKTAKEIQDELKAKIKQATQGAAQEDKAKAEAPAAPAAEAPKETPKEEAKPAAAAAAPAAPADEEEDEIERMIREMEEADAKREKEEEEHRKRKEAEKAANKEKDEANRKANAAEEDRKLREQEREMERLEEEKERKRNEAESSGKTVSVAEALAAARDGKTSEDNVESVADKLADMNIGDKVGADKRAKPAALNLAPINTKPVEPPQPTPAMQSLKSARFLEVIGQDLYPEGIKSPNPALNAAVAKKGKTFRYDASFLLQFQKVFTEQPSIEFHQQVKSLIGEDGGRSAARTPASARQGSRGGASFPGGAFNAPPGRGPVGGGLPKSASGVNPMAAFRPGAPFPAPGMVRSGSNKNMSNTRNGSRSTRGNNNSRRAEVKEAQAAKTMPLTAGMEIKPIAITSTGWKPTSVGRAPQPGASAGYMDPEMVQRKVKAALNKMTPENFDRIAEQILEIAGQSKDETDGRTLRQVIQLTFEKATDEAHWASMYAKFCKRMLESMNPDVRDERIKDKNQNVVTGGNLFRKYLLNRCQEEFERGWTVNVPEATKEGEETEKKEDAEADKKTGEAALLSDEYYQAAAAKRRGLGLVQFIGELYKLGMLTERIMHECVRKLVDHKGVPDEAEVESLCKLLRTIGANLDDTEKGRPMMDAYFQRIQNMIDLPEMNSRIKFMLMDIVDLRKQRWVSKEADKGPKTLDEVRAEAEAAQVAKAQEAARTNQRGGGGRPPVGRGDARAFSGGYQQQTSNQVGMDDLRRLKGSLNRTASQNVTLGPTSMFASRSNSGRRMGPGGAIGRPGDESGLSSRAATPPTNTNAFSLLANMETETPASPPSAAASPALSKAVPEDGEKKESE